MISVLYVDDEGNLLDICKLFLEQTKEFSVTTASSASAALTLLKSNGTEAIVSDYQMPEMDGIELLKQVRATNKTIPFILFTGRGREEIAIQAFENGADYYLQKGGEPKSQFAELMLKIRTAVNHRRDEAQVTTLNRLYTVLSATNKAIVHIHDKKELLNEICRIVVDTGGFKMAWAGIVNTENHLIEPTAIAGHVDSYLDKILISTDNTPRGQGPTGTAFRTGTFVISNDVEHDPLMAPWRKSALEQGFRSLAAFPFALDSRNAGVITFYAAKPGFFNDQIIRLLEEQSGDISFALQTIDHEEQRITAENELKKSELQYRRLFQTAQDAILILDGDTGEIIDANKFILDMLGYPLEYFIGKHLWELGFLKDKSLSQDAFLKLKTEGYIRYEDLPLETKQEKEMHVEFISNVYLVGEKRIIQCNIRDITARKQTESALLESEKKYRILFEQMLEGFAYCRMIYDEKGRPADWIYLNVNAAFARITGLENITGKRVLEVLPDIREQTPELFDIYGRVASTGIPETFEIDFKPLKIWLKISVFCPEKEYFVAVFEDITVRKQTDERLHHLAAIVTSSENAIVGKTLEGIITSWNASAEKIYGYTASEAIGKPISILVPPGERDEIPMILARIRAGETIRYFETKRMTKDGRIIDVSLIVSPIKNDEGIITGASTIVSDITERRKEETAIRQANKKLNILSGITRHDIRNQLLALKGYLEISKEYAADAAKMSEFIGKEEQVANTIERQITFTKEYEDLGVHAPVWHDCRTLVDTAVTQVSLGKVLAKNDIPPGTEIFADPLIVKVFYNLVENAVRHGGKITTLRFSLQNAGDIPVIICEDDGDGVAGNEKEKIFERGFGKNTGLGLFLTREILSITGITITETGQPGKGARFEITLPKDMYRISPAAKK